MKAIVKQEIDKAMVVIKFKKDLRVDNGSFRRNPQELFVILGKEYQDLYNEFAPNQMFQ
jgi:hypothetical protein